MAASTKELSRFNRAFVNLSHAKYGSEHAVTAKANEAANNLMLDLASQVAEAAAELTRAAKKKTIDAAAVAGAVRMVLGPCKLATHATAAIKA